MESSTLQTLLTAAASAGVCGMLAVFLVYWLVRHLVPSIQKQFTEALTAFREDSRSEREIHKSEVIAIIEQFTSEREKDRVSRHDVADKLNGELLNLGTKIERATQQLRGDDKL